MSETIERVYGDNRPINFLVSFPDSGPVDLSAYTLQITIEKDDGTAVVTAATTGLTAQPTQSFTADSATDRLTKYEHGLKDDDQVILTTSAADLPAPLATSTRYFVVNRDDLSFQLATTPRGTPINITDAGTGTHTFAVVGSGQYLPQTTYAVGTYRAWVLLVGSTTGYVPEKQYGFAIRVYPVGN